MTEWYQIFEFAAGVLAAAVFSVLMIAWIGGDKQTAGRLLRLLGYIAIVIVLVVNIGVPVSTYLSENTTSPYERIEMRLDALEDRMDRMDLQLVLPPDSIDDGLTIEGGRTITLGGDGS